MYNKVTKVGTTALREILRPEADRRARTGTEFVWDGCDGTAQNAIQGSHLDILCDDIDANTRALAVALGWWENCRWGIASAPTLCFHRDSWALTTPGHLEFYKMHANCVLDACHAIWASLEADDD